MASWADLPAELKLSILRAAVLDSNGLAHAITPVPLQECTVQTQEGPNCFFQSQKYFTDILTCDPVAPRWKSGATREEVQDGTFPLNAILIIRQCAAAQNCFHVPDTIIARILFWTQFVDEKLFTLEEDQFTDADKMFRQRPHYRSLSLYPYDDQDAESSEASETSSESASEFGPDSDGDIRMEDADPSAEAEDDENAESDGSYSETEYNRLEMDYEDNHDFMSQCKVHARYGGPEDTFSIMSLEKHFGYQWRAQKDSHFVERSSTHCAMTAANLLRTSREMRQLIVEVIIETIRHYKDKLDECHHAKRVAWIALESFCLSVAGKTGLPRARLVPYIPEECRSAEVMAQLSKLAKPLQCEWEIDWYLRIVAELTLLSRGFV